MAVREVTTEEVAFLEEHGWVLLERLVDQSFAGELLAAGKELWERSRAGWESAKPMPECSWLATWRDFGDWVCGDPTGASFGARKIRAEPFYSFMLGKEIGRAAHTLQNRGRLTDDEVGVRYFEDALVALPPDKEDRPWRWHQDESFGTDRSGGFNVWIALDEVTPEMGAVRFLTGSFVEGPLGSSFGEGRWVVDQYPKLLELYELSPPITYQPGDVTIHYGYTVHGTPENRTDRLRWSYIPTYLPSDNIPDDGNQLGLPEPHERFPLVYP
jgi:hypothetical protein